MKNIFKFILAIAVMASFSSCEEDLIVYSNSTFVQLSNSSATSLVENSGQTIEVVAILGDAQSTDTQVAIDVVGDAARYTISSTSATIPAGETSATFSFSAIDDDEINGDADVVISLSSSSSVPIGVAGEGNFSVSKTISIIDDNVPCNNYSLTVFTDAFPSETTWEIRDADDNIVYTGGQDYGPDASVESRLKEYNHDVPLEDGCYTFIMYDVFGDGMADGVVEGSWSLSCGALTVSSGVGNFGFSDSTDFCVNQ
ncbi:hypothetical protein ITJ86_09370 [Winogradskyella sp. F6397]|uniref:Calx-beta domain-containing protein n=1 Tax=Winogradskyella marina TaxID=2785530 RepID=A0ABS0EL16_9FLAO|nr:hypothetical protein [Winogradskyella marina]MBF8150105.1 hypothetical protein [Winogradskyella marina]